MRLWVGVTDEGWFRHLRRLNPEEVNFWQPRPRALARFLEPGVPFLFKLRAPKNAIVGGGYFVRYSELPARLAWEAFRENNGVAGYAALRERIQALRNDPVGTGDPTIGCNILNAPFFLREAEWIRAPEAWAPNIVRGRSFDTAERDGKALWDQVIARLAARGHVPEEANDAARFGAEYLTRVRLGQGAFRVLVTEAYARRCAITGERTLPVLEAAHIQPYAAAGAHRLSNGLLLRSDLHTLFDAGYLTVTDDLRIEVSRRIREEFENGREYYQHHGQALASLPRHPEEQPSRDALRWHNHHVFLP